MSALISLFVVGWVTFAFSLRDVGTRSVTLLQLAMLPFAFKMSARSVCYLTGPFASLVCAMLVAWSTDGGDDRIYSNAGQQFLAMLLAAGIAGVDWRRYATNLTAIIVVVAVPIVAFGGYQMIARIAHLPLAFLPVTNQQEYAFGGLQRGWQKPGFTRASSLFVEPSEFGYFCLWLAVLGFAAKNIRWRIASFTLAAAGILFSQSLSAVLGLGVLLAVYVLTHPISTAILRQLMIIVVTGALAIAIIPQLMPTAFGRFSQRIEQALTFDERADSDRVNHIPQNWKIFIEAPVWGHGLANVAVADGQNGTSITYSLLLMERGLVGTTLFFIPWVVIGWRSWRLPKNESGRTLAILLTVLNFFSFSTFATVYYLPFWFSLGLTASLTLNTAKHFPRRTSSRECPEGRQNYESIGDPGAYSHISRPPQ